jgi:hypothetical protein
MGFSLFLSIFYNEGARNSVTGKCKIMRKAIPIVHCGPDTKTIRSFAGQDLKLFRWVRLGILGLTATIFLFTSACRSEAQNYLVGVRAGSSFEGDAGEFQEVDAFGGVYLPWLWGKKDGFNLKLRVDASAGCLIDRGEEGFIGSLGPALELHEGNFPVSIEGGVSLTGLSQSNFQDRDLGGWFQFTDHIGLNFRITKHVTLGWRFQHISNAGIYSSNPGLNQMMLSTSYSF